ncbi:TBC1 domain family member 7-like [Centruroides sculpturatus]|uniref:TBC1 domain family member 7-like n=1 Tax=Centruroides sculpturatus TaxID=218467 RepID=UPI000C6EB818|nr:TBC1 domain family member 7-like [Centruroides sculpturatus]
MADDSRNFRSYYYDKVGFRGVEEKKSLEILLRDKPIDMAKLAQFCLRFSLPSMYREYVWKLLLGILSRNSDSHKLVSYEQKEQCKYLEHSLRLMQKINDDTAPAIVLTYMLLLEQGRLVLNEERQFQEEETKNIIAIASAFTKMCSSKEDAYWMTRNFCKCRYKFSNILPTLTERMEAVLKKNDPELYSHLENLKVLHKLPTKIWFGRCFAEILSESALESLVYFPLIEWQQTERMEAVLKKNDPELYSHLENLKVLHKLPTKIWFGRCFAEILSESALERIWDKIIAGCCKVLAFVGAALLMVLRRPLLGILQAEEVLEFLTKVPDDTADVVANKALELWQVKHKEER